MLTRLTISAAILSSLLVSTSADGATVHKRVHNPGSAVVKHRPVHRATNTISSSLREAWNKVAQCEEGGNWAHWTWWYPDGIGIDRPNFAAFGGNPNVVNSIAQQITVAQRFVAYYHMGIPDQEFCGPY